MSVRDYNCIILVGTVRSGPTLTDAGRKDKNTCTKLSLHVSRDKGRRYNDIFEVRGYGAMGTEMLQMIRQNDRILVEGNVMAGAYTGQDGKPKPKVYVIAHKWMPDPVQKEVDGRETEALRRTGIQDNGNENYGDNAEMLFGGF